MVGGGWGAGGVSRKLKKKLVGVDTSVVVAGGGRGGGKGGRNGGGWRPDWGVRTQCSIRATGCGPVHLKLCAFVSQCPPNGCNKNEERTHTYFQAFM